MTSAISKKKPNPRLKVLASWGTNGMRRHIRARDPRDYNTHLKKEKGGFSSIALISRQNSRGILLFSENPRVFRSAGSG